jgi:mono/diheme cytochrome c family protein
LDHGDREADVSALAQGNVGGSMRKVAGSKFGRIGIVLGCALMSAALCVGVAGLLTGVRPALAQGPQTDSKGKPIDTASVARGLRLFRDQANCTSCHGWNGQGSQVEPRPPSLITTQLDKDALVEAIACGRVGRTMPNHLAGSWTPAFPCYGGKLTKDIGEDQMPRKPFATLTMDEINDVANYILAFYKGKLMTVPNCVAYFGSSSVQECVMVFEDLIDYQRN